MNETMYDRIKRMSKEEMANFIYWVYMNGNRAFHGKGLCDSEYSYFGGYILDDDVSEVMPNGNIDDLWNNF